MNIDRLPCIDIQSAAAAQNDDPCEALEYRPWKASGKLATVTYRDKSYG